MSRSYKSKQIPNCYALYTNPTFPFPLEAVAQAGVGFMVLSTDKPRDLHLPGAQSGKRQDQFLLTTVS